MAQESPFVHARWAHGSDQPHSFFVAEGVRFCGVIKHILLCASVDSGCSQEKRELINRNKSGGLPSNNTGALVAVEQLQRR